MNVFISWSGDRSKKLSEALSEFLPRTLQGIKVWMSHENIQAGSRWGEGLNQQLEESRFGVLCLTPENFNAPWILFEAGSLAKNVSGSRVVPYLLGLASSDIDGPLAEFQVVDADENGTKKLVQSLNSALESPIDESRLDDIFGQCWPTLRSQVEKILADRSPNSLSPREIKQERESVSKFYERVKGTWWERILKKGIGFFHVEPDELHNSVQLHGQFFDIKGDPEAKWKSEVARVSIDKIIYLRRCFHLDSPREGWIHGYGEMEFKGPSKSFNQGDGSFFDVDRDSPEKTIVYPVVLRRIDDANEIVTMDTGTDSDKQSLVLKKLREW